MQSYSDTRRTLGLQVCAPELIHGPDVFAEYISKLKSTGNFEHAAGLIFFQNMDLAQSIDCLHSSGEERLILIATVLAGASSSGKNSDTSLWKTMCKSLSSSSEDPHMKLIFALISNDGNLASVLSDPGLQLWEVMPIAIRYLNDQDLNNYIQTWAQSLKEFGRIDGLLLWGWDNKSSIELIQNYIDRTSDVQSAALLMQIRPSRNESVSRWVASYTRLLNQWQLFHQRATFDMCRKDKVSIDPQVFIRCNYCNNSISPSSKPTLSHSQTLNAHSSKTNVLILLI